MVKGFNNITLEFFFSAAQMRVIYNQRLVSIASQRMKVTLSVKEIVNELSRHLKVAECQVYGYHSLQGDIILLIAPVVHNPRHIQVWILGFYLAYSYF